MSVESHSCELSFFAMRTKKGPSDRIRRYVTTLRRLFVFAIAIQSLVVQAQVPAIPEIPQIPAFLPMMHTVPAGETTPIDGEWIVTSINKRIRIQAGRAYAVDPWVHLFVLKIQPLMVVLTDIRRVGSGEYSGQDLPLMGGFTARLDSSGNLSVSVAGALGPANYTLAPISQDDPQLFNDEKNGRYRTQSNRSNDRYPEGDRHPGDSQNRSGDEGSNFQDEDEGLDEDDDEEEDDWD